MGHDEAEPVTGGHRSAKGYARMPRPLASPATDPRPATGVLARGVRLAMLVMLGVLLVEVLFEAWIQELLGDRTVNEVGLLVGYIPEWPKTLKNSLVIALALASALTITLERRWREFWTGADRALVALTIIMIIAGLLGTSGPELIGEAIFVYLRGAAVFYAVRALRPTWTQVRRLLWVVVPIIGLNVLVAVVQVVVGRPAYSGIGWVDMAWADTNRAMGLLDHPNQLGHVLGLVLIGLIAWMSGLPKVDSSGRRWLWWLALAVAAVGLATTQSRESVLGVLAAAALIWFLRYRRWLGRSRRDVAGGPPARDAASAGDAVSAHAPAPAVNAPPSGDTPDRQPVSAARTILIASAVVAVLFGGYTVARPDNFSEFANRIAGIFSAVQTPPGTEDCDEFETNAECVEAGRVEKREIRMLFYQQGARLLAERPILGYGVGQFGGIVAEKHDPNWELDPRFPGGFNLYDFDGTTVDSFWLHLVVEVGVLGLLAYLTWLWLLSAPLLAATPRFAGRRVWGAGSPRARGAGPATPAALWGAGVVVFGVISAFFSPCLEDAIYPVLSFAIIGVAWVLNSAGDGRGSPAQPVPEGTPDL